MYTQDGLSMAKIGRIYNCDASVVHRNLRDYGISSRSLSDATTKVHATKKQLIEWYWKVKLSMSEIAHKLGCTHSAIVYKFKKLGIKSRGHLGLIPAMKISKDTLEYFYHSKRLSLDKIAKILHRSEGGVTRKFIEYGLVSRSVSERACKYAKNDFSGDLVEKAYLLGFRLGDLNVYDLKNIIQIRCSSTHSAQIKLIRAMFNSYTTPHSWMAKRGTTEIVCLLNKSFGFLVPKEDEVPEWVMENDSFFWAFFAGYSDAEGSFTFKKPKKFKGVKTAYFTIQSQQLGIIHALSHKLNMLSVENYGPHISKRAGVVDKRGVKNNKDMWRIDIIKKRSLWIFCCNIQKFVKHKEKVSALKRVRENILHRNIAPYTKPISLDY